MSAGVDWVDGLVLLAPRVLFIEFLVALPAAVVLFINFNLLPQFLMWLFGEPDIPPNPFEPIIRSPAQFEALSFMILAILFGPVAEEFLFRGLLFNTVRQKLHVIVAMPLQALAFGFYHPFGVVFSSSIAVGALGVAAVYEWRKTLLTPILIHVMINVMGLTLMTLGFTPDANAPRLGISGTAMRGVVSSAHRWCPEVPRRKQVCSRATWSSPWMGRSWRTSPVSYGSFARNNSEDTLAVEFLRGAKLIASRRF